MGVLNPLLSSTTATAGARDATAPVPGALRDAGLATIVVGIAASAAQAACAGDPGAAAFAAACGIAATKTATFVLSLLSGAGVGLMTFFRKLLANKATA